jgi:predicted RNA polymerase sigma factor
VFRRESGRILATLIRISGSFDRAEEAMQEAFAAALTSWPERGIPQNPAAWITTAAQFMDNLNAAELESYHLYHSARAEILRRMGRRKEAIQEYEQALPLTTNAVEQRYLRRRIAELGIPLRVPAADHGFVEYGRVSLLND